MFGGSSQRRVRGPWMIVGAALLATMSACSGERTEDGGLAEAPFTVTSVSISPTQITLKTNSTVHLAAKAHYSHGTDVIVSSGAYWSSSNPAIVTVDGYGTVRSTGVAGSATVSARFEGMSANASISVTNSGTAQLTSLRILPEEGTLDIAVSRQYTAVGAYSDGSTALVDAGVTWSSGAPAVASVSTGGIVTGRAYGLATITARHTSGFTATKTVSVSARRALTVDLPPPSAGIRAGTTQPLTLYVNYSDGTRAPYPGTVLWSTANPAIATVNANGLVLGVAPGATSISAREPLGSWTATAPIAVTGAALQSVTIAPVAATLVPGGKLRLTGIARYTDGTTADVTSALSWSAGNTAVATVDSSGTVTGVTVGTTSITARHASGISGSASITVSSQRTVTGIALSPATFAMAAGRTQQLAATAAYSDGTTGPLTAGLAWTSSSPSVATVSASGLVTAVSVGSAEIRVTESASGRYAAAYVTVTPSTTRVLMSIAVAPSSSRVQLGGTQQLTATGAYSDGTTGALTSGLVWSSSSTTVASVGASGLVSGTGLGTAKIQVKELASGVVSAGANVEVASSLYDATLWYPGSLPYFGQVYGGTPRRYDVAGLTPGATYSILVTGRSQGGNLDAYADAAFSTWACSDYASDPETLSCSGKASSSGHIYVVLSTSGVSSPFTLRVVPSTTRVLMSIAVTPSSSRVQLGGTQQLTATGTYTDGTTGALTTGLVWSSSSAAVASVGASGLMSGTALGTAKIQVKELASGVVSAGANVEVVSSLYDATLWYPGSLPYSGQLYAGTPRRYDVAGLTPGATYSILVTGRSQAGNLDAYADAAFSTWACSDYASDSETLSCSGKASSSGHLYVVLSTSGVSSPFTLGVR